ncbi:MAG: Unknown protein [uncultured Sulfurovum sp.]|uniref:Uncharacterized protein n=1 Tax=uncultured Sulfurovum sp. TaxID=269237 RepID=A0A6S6U6M8_9BACT|nr:MAG: Unknown protein [uncultured Sulfurovum sp.]
MKYLHIHALFFPILWLGLYLDSELINQQWITNILVFITFIWIYTQVSKQIKQLMFYGLIVALGGELLFALVFGMYTYRLENLPIYVPFGHTIIYACIYYFIKEPIILKHREKIINVLYIAMIIYSTLWFIFANDVFGFLCLLVILVIFKRRPQTKLFFLFMFFAIVYLELVGTYYQCWYWPETWFDKVPFITSANPPSAISVFYFGFDAGCLWFYKKLQPHKWQRFKNIKKIKQHQA